LIPVALKTFLINQACTANVSPPFIGLLRDRGDMAILLVEQYFEFAQALADRIAVMDRGRIVLAGKKDELDEEAVRGRLTV